VLLLRRLKEARLRKDIFIGVSPSATVVTLDVNHPDDTIAASFPNPAFFVLEQNFSCQVKPTERSLKTNSWNRSDSKSRCCKIVANYSLHRASASLLGDMSKFQPAKGFFKTSNPLAMIHIHKTLPRRAIQ
jgi:hypothetical protein